MGITFAVLKKTPANASNDSDRPFILGYRDSSRVRHYLGVGFTGLGDPRQHPKGHLGNRHSFVPYLVGFPLFWVLVWASFALGSGAAFPTSTMVMVSGNRMAEILVLPSITFCMVIIPVDAVDVIRYLWVPNRF
jgi:hypothetical protein